MTSDSMKHTRNGKGDRTCCPAIETIEFIGGSYDGHKELCRTQTVHLPRDLVWIVCEDAFRMLEGRDSHPGGSITSVALYALEATKDARRYRFTRSNSLEELMESMPETCSCLETQRDTHHGLNRSSGT